MVFTSSYLRRNPKILLNSAVDGSKSRDRAAMHAFVSKLFATISTIEASYSELQMAFAEMARRIWILHCLAFSVDEEVSVFNVGKNCRFSEVYMESVTNEALLAGNNRSAVAFTVVPGFKIGKTVVQSKVFLAQEKA
ncbi:hypothetical protein AgCh_027922 [Apium graveolens]